MEIDELREALRRRPFETFALMVTDGRSITIRHPDFVALSARTIIVVGEDDEMSFVDATEISSIERPEKVNPSMNIDSVREALRREPFRPFVLRLADGRALPVRHPDFVALTPRLVVVGFEDDTLSIIEPLLIVSIDLPAQSESGGNGKHRRRKSG